MAMQCRRSLDTPHVRPYETERYSIHSFAKAHLGLRLQVLQPLGLLRGWLHPPGSARWSLWCVRRASHWQGIYCRLLWGILLQILRGSA